MCNILMPVGYLASQRPIAQDHNLADIGDMAPGKDALAYKLPEAIRSE